jgi:hypothetical protein
MSPIAWNELFGLLEATQIRETFASGFCARAMHSCSDHDGDTLATKLSIRLGAVLTLSEGRDLRGRST